MNAPRRIKVNGINLNVYDEGDGPPILLLHGFPDNALLWRRVIPHLVQSGYRAIAYDQRGFGESDAPVQVEAYGIENIVSDAIELMRVLNVDSKIRLVGHDWGSLIGWHLSLMSPELVERYVTVTVGHPLAFRRAGIRQKIRSWYVIAFQIPGLAEWMFSAGNFHLLRSTTKRSFSPGQFDVERWISDLSRPGRLTAGINWYRANFARFLAADFPRGTVPTLGIHTENDVALTVKQMTDSKRYMDAQWRCVMIANTSHWIPLEQPEELAAHIIDWFSA